MGQRYITHEGGNNRIVLFWERGYKNKMIICCGEQENIGGEHTLYKARQGI